ncbi:MAG: glycosyltransferase family 4 protein [Clostridium sp.]
MKKILYVSRDLTHMYFHLSYLKHLKSRGYDVQIGCNINKDTADFEKSGIKCVNIDFERKALTFLHGKAYSQFRELCKKENYDLIVFNTPIAAFIGRIAIRDLKIKSIYMAHGLHFFSGAPLVNWIIYYPLEKIASRWTDGMILINNEDFKRANDKFRLRSKGKFYYINGVGIETDKFNASEDIKNDYYNSLNITKDNLVITCVAELNSNKNQIQLLQAVNECNNKYNIKLILVGEGDQEVVLKEYCKEHKLSNVEFLGYRRDVPNILAVSDILTLISHREGLPKSIMEGMASGLAILGTNTRGIRDMIKDGENGYIVEVGDYKELAKKIDSLYENKELLKQMKECSKSNSEQYDSSYVISELDNVLEDFGV